MDLNNYFLSFGYFVNKIVASLGDDHSNPYEISTKENPSCQLGYGFMICLDLQNVMTTLFNFSYGESMIKTSIDQMVDYNNDDGTKLSSFRDASHHNDGIYFIELENNYENHLFMLVISGDNVTYYGTYGGVPYYIVREYSSSVLKSILTLMASDPKYYYLLTSGNPEMTPPSKFELGLNSINVTPVLNPDNFNKDVLIYNLKKLLRRQDRVNYPKIRNDVNIIRTSIKLLEE